MSIHNILEVHCDQNPLPNRCSEKLVLDVHEIPGKLWLAAFLRTKDWGVVDVDHRTAHYCPKHRPVR